MRRRLPRARHTLVVPGPEPRTDDDGFLRIRTVRAPLVSRAAGYRALLDLDAVTQILAEESPDLVECSDPYQLAWRATAAGRALGIPVVGFYHSHFVEAYLEPLARRRLPPSLAGALVGLGRRYTVRTYRRFARTLVPSPALAEELAAWGLENTSVAELGMDGALFHPGTESQAFLRERLGWPEGRFVLLYVGRLAPEKNTRLLFAAFARLHAAEPERFHLVVVGDGPHRDALPREAVTWLPRLPAAELPDCYRAANLFVHPGVMETFGLVTVEAQACGLPVCGVRGSRMDRLAFGGSHASWATENAPAPFVDAVLRFAALSNDARRAMGAEAARTAARFHWDTSFQRIFDIYRDVMAGMPARRAKPPHA